ncbi:MULTISPECIES: AraC family transcriptional regulator [unclassified Pseudomonas]|jgi:AraC-like DNA-binding protein|uniref:AraC family transcriptional regulator n=1 Tax=unclassified Pseudomonas TaxID=196821 RepID=UPI000C84B6B0|nr:MULTISPECIES: helix-turn-helix transcriptional regulator [unclassified Pseudomonas]MDX9673860.1 helix-turn-helix transcriptional regulator [Pseudomonas sp. P8_250]PMQ11710.1 HTH-type transcriptional repressor of iron proteins A [Pseudomonas sp. AD21]WPN37616.1 helix-turn-helix transcriptional regulator [Pseudomonas sp. P8_139]WPN40582.1 helix-turn-helix transcriptional regulator [Pseudomonas sp. P8_229]
MAWLDAHATFDPDHFSAPVIGIASTLGDHDSGLHCHQRGQLLYTRQGCTRITLAQQLCLLPPSRAAWIPGGVSHRAVMQQSVDYRSIWLLPELCRELPQQVCVIEVSPLLRAVLEPMAQADFASNWQHGKLFHLLGLCLSEIREAAQQPMLLPLPRDKRLAPLLSTPEQLPPELQLLEQQIGASSRTIGRIFQRETGMSYQQWRQQWRLMRAMELLATGRSLSYCGYELGFASDSAFIAFFKAMSGTTPGHWLK